MRNIKTPWLFMMAVVMFVSCDESGINDLPQMQPELVEFKVTNPEAIGTIDQTNGTVLLKVPVYADIQNLVPDIHVSYGSKVSPESGTEVDFSSPVVFTIENGGVTKSYTVTVEAGALDTKSARILVLGTGDNINSITNADEKAATAWALGTFDLAKYMSFSAFKANTSILEEIDAVWWHFDTSYELASGNFALPDIAYDEVIVTALKNFRNSGGGIYLSGFATQYLKILEVVPPAGNPDEQGGAPADFANADNWGISFKGYKDHPIFEGLRTKIATKEGEVDEDDVAFLISGGASRKDNKSWWVVIDEDFPYGTDLASTEWDKDHNILVLLAEFPGTETQGKVVGFSAGAYDWFSVQGENTYLDNVKKITRNILLYTATPKSN
jgi:hypothetical protein